MPRLQTGEPETEPEVTIEGVELRSDHGLLKGCAEARTWKDEGARCAEGWAIPSALPPASASMGTPLRLALRLRVTPPSPGPFIEGEGPEGMRFRGAARAKGASALVATKALERRIHKLRLTVGWSARGAALSPPSTSSTVFVTMGRPHVDRRGEVEESGVTLRRMETAMAWVEPLATLDPHAIVAGLMARFPHYSLRPSPKVPRAYHHPTYFNHVGGAWCLAEHEGESAECQAIVRLLRAILWQLGIPGAVRILTVWADPTFAGGKRLRSADWEKDPRAGLDASKKASGKRWVAGLIDAEVEVGKTYPPSHTLSKDGESSPGLNRFEACLELSHGGKRRYYAGGVGVFDDLERVLDVFWGLVWVSPTDDGGFVVEEIVRRFDEEEAHGDAA